MAWSEDDKALVRNLWDKGLTGSEIAAMLPGKVSRSAVVGMAHRMGLESRVNPVMTRDMIFERVCDRVIEPPYETLADAAKAESMPLPTAIRMWNERIASQHGGDPK